jgi:hypothetical protein
MTTAGTSADANFRADEPTATMIPCKSKDWIDFCLVDGDGRPIPGIRYRLDSSDGGSAEGVTDENGCAGADGLDPGKCRITWLPPEQ